MAQAANPNPDGELVDRFEEFFRRYYSDEVGELARQYPREQKSLTLEWGDLYTFDTDLADDYLQHPDQLQDAAEEALRLYDLPIDVSLGQAHVRVRGLGEYTEIRDIRAENLNTLVGVQGMVRKATDVKPKIREAVFVCQRCGHETIVPQADAGFQEPYQCESCERQGPFKLNPERSEFVDSQKLRIQESPEGLAGGETPQSIDVHVEDDITGEVTPGDHVTVTGVLRLDQSEAQNESPIFDVYLDGVDVVVEDEEFEEMDITDEDKKEIVEISDSPTLYEDMVDSMAPAIYGHREAKLAMILQLFSGVTKNLPDGSRIRGDLHMLLIGDPGTGKCVSGDTRVTLADGTERPIRELVEENLDDPKPIDDGVWDDAEISLPGLDPDGSITEHTATRVWKREAPENLYRVRTSSGREVEVTPSHPLFVQRNGRHEAVRAESLEAGEFIAVAPRTATDGGVAAAGSTADVPTRATFDRIESIEAIEPSEEWVYDLEVAGVHNYLTNGVVSHNSQMISYIQNIAPRSVYTSGKGSSSAGLCVTGDTLVHTGDGFREIGDVVKERLPDPVDAETAVEDTVDLYTFDRESGTLAERASSHLWRMPEKPCRRIETAHGKELEASVNTPVLTCGASGIEWKPISEVEAGDHVAVPKYGDLDRTEIPVRDFLELTEEKVKLADESIDFLQEALREAFGTLRDAAAALDLSEDFVYSHLPNRHVPLEKLDRMLDAVDATREDVVFDRLMLRHGDSIRVPETFDGDLMYLLGLVFGDGDIALDRRDGNRGLVRLSNGDESVLDRAREIFAEAFDKEVEIEYQDDRVPCIRVNSATIARLFQNAGMQSPKEGLALDPQFTTAAHADAFLRGLMDADGSVSQRSDGGSSVLLSTISDDLARQVQLMLETYGVRARTRERDRRGTYELADGRTIESKHVQHFVELYGANIERYADAVGFEIAEKAAALESIVGDAERREETIPVGSALATVDGPSGDYYMNVNRGDNPGRGRARAMLADIDLGDAEPLVEEAVDADLRWDEVVATVDTGKKEVFDLTVPDTHNFLGNGVVTHNTAAAVRDDFGDGQQWTLEAGALVLADQGIAAVDELDKMRCVTGDTLVTLGDGSIERIGDIARDAADTGTVEVLENGRTVRDFGDLSVLTMADDGRVVERPVTAVHEYDTPEDLTEVTLESGEQLTSTPDHPYFVFEDGERVERGAAELEDGDWVYVPRQVGADGGTTLDSPNGASIREVARRRVASVEPVDNESGCVSPSVYDLTVEGTHNFVANGMIVHNSEDRSAMHEALEQQKISISKAGINATLKARCSLLGAANPKYGRFDEYEPIGEQIDLEPALVSRFDLIFTVTDKPDPEEDSKLAKHILQTNYAGELNTNRTKMANSTHTQEEVDAQTNEVAPAIDADLLRKYIAYSRRSCYPTMSAEARQAIEDFYVNLRAKGADEDAPVPVTARKLEGLVRLAEASARVRLSDTVEKEDAERVIEITRSCLQDIGVDPETGEFDADVVETGRSKTQRDRIRNVKGLIDEIESDFDEGAPVEEVLARAEEVGIDEGKAEHEIEKLKKQGEVYEPSQGHLRTT